MKNRGYRKNTKFDEVSAAFSTISFGSKVLEWIKKQQFGAGSLTKLFYQALKAQQQQKQIERQFDQNLSDQQKQEAGKG